MSPLVFVISLLERVLFWGFGNLLAGVGASLLMLGAASSLNAGGLFLLLAVVGAELALVTWLGQRNEEALLQD